MKRFSDLNIITHSDSFVGEKIKISKILNRDIVIIGFKIENSKYPKNKSGKCLFLQIELEGAKKVVFSGSDVLISTILQVKREDLPIACSIIQEGEHFEFI